MLPSFDNCRSTKARRLPQRKCLESSSDHRERPETKSAIAISYAERPSTYPESNANTTRNVDAALRNTSPSLSCDLLLVRICGCLGANIELGVGDIDA